MIIKKTYLVDLHNMIHNAQKLFKFFFVYEILKSYFSESRRSRQTWQNFSRPFGIIGKRVYFSVE